jgi:uncharacterized protein YyaL (SSP411 family)
VYKDGESRFNGYLDDYAFIVGALIDLYEATFDIRWFEKAIEINETMIQMFWDEEDGGFFFTGADHEQLIVRSKNPYDNAIPSGNSVAAHNLIRLAAYTGREDYRDRAERILLVFADFMQGAPNGFGHLLCALSRRLGRSLEIALVGSRRDETMQAMIEVINRRFMPYAVTALYDPDNGDSKTPDIIPLLADRPAVDGRTTVYVCENFACRRPVTTVDDLSRILDELSGAQDHAAP